jgi:hypothetical protein
MSSENQPALELVMQVFKNNSANAGFFGAEQPVVAMARLHSLMFNKVTMGLAPDTVTWSPPVAGITLPLPLPATASLSKEEFYALSLVLINSGHLDAMSTSATPYGTLVSLANKEAKAAGYPNWVSRWTSMKLPPAWSSK